MTRLTQAAGMESAHPELMCRKEVKANSVVVSYLRDFYKPVEARGFAVKYVVDGVERYKLGKETYTVDAGSYLLLNVEKDGKVEIESHNIVKGVCVNITPAMMCEVVASRQQPGTAYADPQLGAYFTTDLFLENQYRTTDTGLGSVLGRIGDSVSKGAFDTNELDIGFFYTLAEQIVQDQVPVFTQLQCVPVIKTATRKDLYRRICRGREFIDACFFMPLSVEQVARECCMSEYHFFRLFKKIFGVSPHQYMMRKRLEQGKCLLEKEKVSVSTAAATAGFADVFSFSKAFRMRYGTAPSALLKS